MKHRWKKTLALLFSAALLLSALPASAASSQGAIAYVTDADGTWYLQTETGLRPIGSANPAAALKNKLTLSAPEKLSAVFSGGMVRLSWPAKKGAAAYQIYRGTEEKQGELIGLVYASGPDFADGKGFWFYDMTPASGETSTYRVAALAENGLTLSTQSAALSIPAEAVPAREGTGSRVQSGSYENGVLRLSPMPVTGIPYNVYVGVATRSGKVVLGTTADNIVTEYDSLKNVASSTFRNPLMKGNYTATMSINIWDSGINFTNPYTMLRCTFDFEVK